MPCFKPELFNGFSKLNLKERLNRLKEMSALSPEANTHFEKGGMRDVALAEHFIENVIGYFEMPLGIACHIKVGDKDYAVPMAVEETSIIAAVSKTAKWIKQSGHMSAYTEGHTAIGQIQLAKVENVERFETLIKKNAVFLIEQANEHVASGLVKRGGGVKDLKIRAISRPDGKHMAVIQLYVDCVDAMGANIINQILEFLKAPIENLSHEKVTMCILSNLNDSQLSVAKVSIENVDKDLGEAIAEASLFAELDPYRAATHNKGVLNGIDPIVIATGNDWRAVEAGIHAYAAKDGQYRSVTRWAYENGTLSGEFRAPISVGIVGGVTKLHPTAQHCLNMLGVTSAKELGQVMAAVGLIQNLGALKALTTDGIIKGHMKLHIDNLMLGVGAKDTEKPTLKEKLEDWLTHHKRVTLANAEELLKTIRGTKKIA